MSGYVFEMNSRLLKFGLDLVNTFKNISIRNQNVHNELLLRVTYPLFRFTSRSYCAPAKDTSGLMEFFDTEENWALNEIRVGRSWRKDELRIKSNEDLHKLWFVLLKERNMLLTMQYEYNRRCELFPSPERLDKVKESMVNLEDVVRERNKAYYMLETGETGERPGRVAKNRLGLDYFFKAGEHVLPRRYNNSWWKKRQLWYNRRECEKFLLLYREKIFLEKRKARIREKNHVMGLLKRFPDLDMEALRHQYPEVDIEELKRYKKTQGHFVSQ